MQYSLVWMLVLTLVKSEEMCTYNRLVEYKRGNCTNGEDRPQKCILENLVKNSTKISIMDKEMKLNSSLQITSLHDVTIEGNNTAINCHDDMNTTISFAKIRNLCLKGLIIRGCGGVVNLMPTTDKKRMFWGAITIINSSNVLLQNIQIDKSKGGGLYLGMLHDVINIMNCIFTKNPFNTTFCQDNKRCGGGLFIENFRKDTHTANISIHHCTFESNSITYISKKIDRRYTNNGAGLYIAMKSPGNTVTVRNCIFSNNIAGYGGGMSLQISNCSYNSTIQIDNTNFTHNSAIGTFAQLGGGLLLGFLDPISEQNCSKNTIKIILHQVQFTSNKGWNGGGLAITGSCNEWPIKIMIQRSVWMMNQARCGAAVSLLRSIWDYGRCHSLPNITFESCKFEKNSNQPLVSVKDKVYLEGWMESGIFFVIYFDITFIGTNTFVKNNSTAIGSINCILYFKNSNTTFASNTGYDGGAISLLGLSYISLSESSLLFDRNSATSRGGAIYVKLVIEATILSAASCFIQSNKGAISPSEWDSNVTFFNNSAPEQQTGKSIYVTSLLPCRLAYGHENRDILHPMEVFSNNKTFTFVNSTFFEEISTAASKFAPNISCYSGFPGEAFTVPIELIDDLDKKATPVPFIMELASGMKEYRHTTGTDITLIGMKGSKLNIHIISTQNPHISKNVCVNLTDCPIGFEFNDAVQKCECSSATKTNGPVKCEVNFTLKIKRRFYVGVLDNKLVTSYCPGWFCNDRNIGKPLNKLPDSRISANYKQDLEKFICYKHRQGTLCGSCAKGYTVYYNSPNFLCKEVTKLCDMGWLFYILSNLLPVTLIFIIITAFDINLTTGSLRGFLLFCQIIVILDKNWKSTQSNVWKIIYDIFRLRFFYIDELSFCLMRNASALDVLSFQYVAIGYALFLVCVTFFWMSYCTTYFNKIFPCIRFTKLKYSFVNGLSALLILCYGSLASISMHILNTATLYHGNNRFGKVRVRLQGNLHYFSPEHLPYAIPALLIVSSIVTVPVVFFLSCPLINKLFDLFKIGTTNTASRIASKCYLGGKLKSFYDVFQGCFKERMQFFAGLYFLYQIMVIVSKIYPTTREQTYFYTSLTLAIILAIHSLAQPYKERLHNIIDTLLLTNLLLINSLSYYIHLAQLYPDTHFNPKSAHVIKAILILLPVIVVFISLIIKLFCQRFGWYKRLTKDITIHNYYRERRFRSIDDSGNESAYGTISKQKEKSYNNEDDDLSTSVKKRQLSLSHFVAHEQLLSSSNLD